MISEPVDPTQPMELSDGRECRVLSAGPVYMHVCFKPGLPLNIRSGKGVTSRTAWFRTRSGQRDVTYPYDHVTLRNRHDPLEFVYDV